MSNSCSNSTLERFLCLDVVWFNFPRTESFGFPVHLSSPRSPSLGWNADHGLVVELDAFCASCPGARSRCVKVDATPQQLHLSHASRLVTWNYIMLRVKISNIRRFQLHEYILVDMGIENTLLKYSPSESFWPRNLYKTVDLWTCKTAHIQSSFPPQSQSLATSRSEYSDHRASANCQHLVPMTVLCFEEHWYLPQ